MRASGAAPSMVGLEQYAAQGGRMGYAGGGISDLRQGYGLGSIVKKATRAIKKIAKSPVGMAALMAIGLPALGKFGAAKGWGGFGPQSFMGTLGKGGWKKAIMGAPGYMKGISTAPGEAGGQYIPGISSLWDRIKGNPVPWILGASAVGGATAEEEDELEGQDFYRGPGLDIAGIRSEVLGRRGTREKYPFLPSEYYAAQGGRIGYDEGKLVAGVDTPAIDLEDLPGLLNDFFEEYGRNPISMDELKKWATSRETSAQGGRIGAQEGGLMDLGGMEKDYRQEGGFVPLGGQERADDVPARLSKNEFVFTADAVRAAGGGDIDAGAEVMENVMENLEQGGQVSEESQGLEGAKNMFATAQRLEGVM